MTSTARVSPPGSAAADALSLARMLQSLLRDAAREAGAIALASFRRGARTTARVWAKEGGSPVTQADKAVDGFLQERLTAALPAAGWLSEETMDTPSRLERPLVWVVDPIDGTRAFMSGHPDWCVAIALLHEGRPILGAIHAPAHRAVYEALQGGGATLNGRPIAGSGAEALAGVRAAGPKSLLDDLDHGRLGIQRLERIPSLALRLARVAEGVVDVGLVSSGSHDWDIAAADLILQEAGGQLSGLGGAVPAYNRAETVHGELAAASRRLHPQVIEAMTARSNAMARHR